VSGYRTSNFDPAHYERAGAPMRPFNWVQWTGVVLAAIGVLLSLAVIAAGFGVAWLRPLLHVPTVFPIVIGSLMISSRRHPYVDEAPEQRARNRRMLLITVAIVAAVLGLATVIEFTGA
jgi:hypothetical protein